MNIEAIRQRVTVDFKPFAILTSDGRRYAVRHPFGMLVGPRTLAVLDDNGHIVSLDPLHVVALKDLRRTADGRAKA